MYLLLVYLSACPLTPTRLPRYQPPETRFYVPPWSIWCDARSFVVPDSFQPEY